MNLVGCSWYGSHFHLPPLLVTSAASDDVSSLLLCFRPSRLPLVKHSKPRRWFDCLLKSNRGSWEPGWERWGNICVLTDCLFSEQLKVSVNFVRFRWIGTSLLGSCRGTITRSRKWKFSQLWKSSERRWWWLTAERLWKIQTHTNTHSNLFQSRNPSADQQAQVAFSRRSGHFKLITLLFLCKPVFIEQN